jgi:signal peptidase II
MINLIKSKKLFFLGLAIIAFVTFADLYSQKQIFAILNNIAEKQNILNPQIEITNFFNLVKVWNRGISFGILSHMENPKYFIIAVNVTIMLGLIVWLYRNQKIYLTAAISLIFGGALGNLMDRLENGAVADFLDFHYSFYHWPAFNLADSAVFLGVVILLIENLFIKNEEK